MSSSFLFYDLETSGVNPRESRVMQFAGQRTDMDLNPIGDPYNYLVRLTPDVLPDPEAVLITGITPQKTITEGISEAEFLKIFQSDIATSGTIFTGFNSVRFDDEFLRFMHYRNFYDPYEWSWKDNRSRWDVLDVIRMTRALRPDEINWPFRSDGVPTNRLELLTELNDILHTEAHDALSDVQATIDVARLIRDKQPKLFSYLLEMRDKRAVSRLVEADEPFLYTSGRYQNDFEKTTSAVRLCNLADQPQTALVFDLRFNPEDYLDKSVEDIAGAWKQKYDERSFHIPVKTLRYNRCPAIAPMGVLDDDSQKRLSLDIATISAHKKALSAHKKALCTLFTDAYQALRSVDQTELIEKDVQTVDGRLYDGFIPDSDKSLARRVVSSSPDKLSTANFAFSDERLQQLLPLYKARNFPEYLSSDEQIAWEDFRKQRLLAGDEQSRVHQFAKRLQACAEKNKSAEADYIIEELKLYAESILPADPSEL